MRDAENIRAVAATQPDFMGFIFYDKSPRYVGADFKIPDDFPDSVFRVGVFVNEKTEEILRLAKSCRLDYLQLHGTESVAQTQELNDAGLKIIKVFSVGEGFDFTITTEYHPYCDYFLFDTKGKYFGGNAKTFDWSLLKSYDQKTPFFLSGGISPENIGKINDLAGLNLFALDVNSGVEVSPGVKNLENIKKIIKSVSLL